MDINLIILLLTIGIICFSLAYVAIMNYPFSITKEDEKYNLLLGQWWLLLSNQKAKWYFNQYIAEAVTIQDKKLRNLTVSSVYINYDMENEAAPYFDTYIKLHDATL